MVAFVPIKMNSVRLKNKNILKLAGHPLCWHITNTLLQVHEIDEVYVYCSDEHINAYLPKGVNFLERNTYLDGNNIKGIEIYKSFIRDIDADIYVLAHATSPFIQAKTISNSLNQVLRCGYDSAYTAKRIQNFIWFDDKPLNYRLEDVPRTQDLPPVWEETSAFFIFRRELMEAFGRRIGFSPYRQEVKGIEAIDIDTNEDFALASAYARMMVKEK